MLTPSWEKDIPRVVPEGLGPQTDVEDATGIPKVDVRIRWDKCDGTNGSLIIGWVDVDEEGTPPCKAYSNHLGCG